MRLTRARSSKNEPREKTAFPNTDTYNISKTQKIASGVQTKPKTRLSDTTELGLKKPRSVYEAWSGYEALVDLSELFMPIHPDTRMPYETPYDMTINDDQWLDWAVLDTYTGSDECLANPDWGEHAATMPEW